MKRIAGDFIEIKPLHHGGGGLLIYGENSVENARKTIDDSNTRRMADGWITKPERYCIVCHEWYRYEDDDGTFLKSEDIVSVIERYPAEEVG